MPHTLEQLRRGIVDFCVVVDQAATGFMWNWVLLPQLLKANINKGDSVVKPAEAIKVVTNATVESSLISIRALDEFFGNTRVRSGDIRSHHYEGYSSPGPFLKRDEYDLIGRRIAHLTIDRADSPQEPWKITELIRRSCERAANFLAFIVEGSGTRYLPGGNFDVASRLLILPKDGRLYAGSSSEGSSGKTKISLMKTCHEIAPSSVTPTGSWRCVKQLGR